MWHEPGVPKYYIKLYNILAIEMDNAKNLQEEWKRNILNVIEQT